MDLKFKTLTLKIGGLCVTKRVLNHKSIPIYYVDYFWKRPKSNLKWSLFLYFSGVQISNGQPVWLIQRQGVHAGILWAQCRSLFLGWGAVQAPAATRSHAFNLRDREGQVSAATWLQWTLLNCFGSCSCSSTAEWKLPSQGRERFGSKNMTWNLSSFFPWIRIA